MSNVYQHPVWEFNNSLTYEDNFQEWFRMLNDERKWEGVPYMVEAEAREMFMDTIWPRAIAKAPLMTQLEFVFSKKGL